MIESWLNKESGDNEARDVLITVAFIACYYFWYRICCIRIWNHVFETRHFSFERYNMCNISLLYRGAQLNGELHLSTIATTDAESTMKNHFRKDWSSYHVVIYEIEAGKRLERILHGEKAHCTRLF